LHGVISVLKHSGVTSHDVVNSLRKLLKTKKVGHTGTLDPLALGVLPVCVGKATRLAEYLTSKSKTYRALLGFGCETDTQDVSGQITKKTELPKVNENQFQNILDNFLGEIEQIPPMFSAIKVNGQPLYKLARKGQEIKREPRKVHIYKIQLLRLNSLSALIEVTCSKGTYIRTLCQDIGRALNSSAYMSFLLRIQSGNFHINNAFSLTEIALMSPDDFLIKPAESLADWPKIFIADDLITRITHGNKIHISNIPHKLDRTCKYKVLDWKGDLVAVGAVKDEYFKPEKVFR